MATQKIIAVNARFLLSGKIEGIGRFSDEVLKRLVRLMPEVQFHFFFDRPYASEFIYAPNVVPHVLYPQARHPFLYVLFFEAAVPFMLKKIKADLFFSPDGYLSLSSAVPQAGVMHDIGFEHFPQDISGIHAWHYRNWFPKYAAKATRLMMVSEFTRKDICATYSIPESKTSVVHNGCSTCFYPLSDSVREEVRATYTGGKPYFLYAGAIQPRKNLENLLKAFVIFKRKSQKDIKLVLTGRKAWNFDQIIQTYQDMPYREDVIFTGYVTDSELNRLYNGALALSYVSRFEGFGLPLLESFYAETPVITSNTSSMPEVAGDAALYVDPDSPESIAEAMLQLSENSVLCLELVEKGRIQRTLFSWEKTAEKCAAVLREILDAGSGVF